MAGKGAEPLPKLHEDLLHVFHLLGDMAMVMQVVKAFSPLPLDHHLMPKDQVSQVIQALQVEEEQLPVLGNMLLGDGRMILSQNGCEQGLLEKFDLVLIEVDLTEPMQVVFMELIQIHHPMIFSKAKQNSIMFALPRMM
jgi:hypothetical protein